MISLCKLISATFVVALPLACNKTTSNDAAYAQDAQTPAMAPASRTRTAAEQIAEARCARESHCGNVGKDKTYSSANDCVTRIQSDWRDDLNARACPGGINQHELDECLQQVREESCDNPFETLARITECTQGQICIEQP